MKTCTAVILSIAVCLTLVSQTSCHLLKGRNRTGIVKLFEWKFSDIAKECQSHLGPNGYYGLLASPVNEYAVVMDPPRPWWERYQPMSYKVITRSGDLDDFKAMTEACSRANVRVFVDVVINHMSASNGEAAVGTSGTATNTNNKTYVGVPFDFDNFHPTCAIDDYQNATNVRVCELSGLHDLDHAQEYVRNKIAGFLNLLIDNGVAGFRVDAAKHVWPAQLQLIYDQLHNLSVHHGYGPNERPFIYQEVVDYGGEPISGFDYIGLGSVSNFKYANYLGQAFRGQKPLSDLKTIGSGGDWDMVPGDRCVVFTENHDTERDPPGNILTFRDGYLYKMGVSFLVAWDYGVPQIMSSYYFDNRDQGPPFTGNYSIADVTTNRNGTCGNGWVCQHRWPEFEAIIKFANSVKGTNVTNWWDNGGNQIAFSRGDRGFIAFNNENTNMNETLYTNLPGGTYCDLITGGTEWLGCAGNSITVDDNGYAQIILNTTGPRYVAITVDARRWW